jgi:hypothetical protein
MHEKPKLNKKVSNSIFQIISYISLCCLPIQIESKYYPPAILLIFSLMMGPRISMFIGLLIGYIEAFGYLEKIILGLNTAAIWEQNSLMKRFSIYSGNSFFE